MDVRLVGTGQVGAPMLCICARAFAANNARIVQMPVAGLIRDLVEAATREGGPCWYGAGRLTARMAGIEPITHAAWVRSRKLAFAPGPGISPA